MKRSVASELIGSGRKKGGRKKVVSIIGGEPKSGNVETEYDAPRVSEGKGKRTKSAPYS